MEYSWAHFVIEKMKTSIVLRVSFLIVCVAIGLFVFILPVRDDVPISREKAEEYTGYFEEFESREKYKAIHFRDGSEYELYPYADPDGIIESLINMTKGTKLYLLINPNNQYVAEIRTETEELLNFETSQEATFKGRKGSIWLGAILCILPVLVLLILRREKKEAVKEADRQKEQKMRSVRGGQSSDTPFLRNADEEKKGRILLSAEVEGFRIVYRRLGFVNELVVNGKVYDEKKAVLEFSHELSASIGGHTIEAGLDSDSGTSYICFDDEIIAEKERVI